jgi:hypothetical protein
LAELRQVDELRLDVPEADGGMVTDVVSVLRLCELYLCSEAVTDAALSSRSLLTPNSGTSSRTENRWTAWARRTV